MATTKHKNREDTVASFDEAMAESVHVKPAHLGQHFDEFLAEEGMLESVKGSSIKRVMAFHFQKVMKEKELTKTDVAKRMKISRRQLDRILDPVVRSTEAAGVSTSAWGLLRDDLVAALGGPPDSLPRTVDPVRVAPLT